MSATLPYVTHLAEEFIPGHYCRDADGRSLPHNVGGTAKTLNRASGGKSCGSTSATTAALITTASTPSGVLYTPELTEWHERIDMRQQDPLLVQGPTMGAEEIRSHV
jgi:hypothetical protein